ELNVHRSVIHRLWNHYQRDQNASRRRGSGRRRITTTPDNRYLLQCARRRGTLTARQLASQLSAAAGRPISHQTVSRKLHEGGLFARRPVVCVPLSPAHTRKRLHWTREHRSWKLEQWGHVLFMSESRFDIQNDSRRTMIWRERYRDTLSGSKHHRKRSLQRWRVTCLVRGTTNSRTDLYLFAERSVTAVRYRDEILHPFVRPFIAAMGTFAIFMDDTARPHRARLVRSYLESETISQMAWPARSLDLNPIEHVRTCWEDGLQVAVGLQTPSTSSNKTYYRNGHYRHNKRSTTVLPACLAVVKHAFQLEGIIPVISVWFPLHILPTNLGCRAATAVIYVILFVFSLLFVMWSINATPSSCTTFTHIH
ncbi:hypothetical protein AVEN_231067-2-1, partial [Araneus ventricosus]